VLPLLEALDQALQGVAYEVIFVDDDSPDGTAALVRQMRAPIRGSRSAAGWPARSRLRLSGRHDGNPGPYVAVMDGDLQHDEGILPADA